MLIRNVDIYSLTLGVLFQSYCILIGRCISADSSHAEQTDLDDPLLPEE